jgi:hypothetical protein
VCVVIIRMKCFQFTSSVCQWCTAILNIQSWIYDLKLKVGSSLMMQVNVGDWFMS